MIPPPTDPVLAWSEKLPLDELDNIELDLLENALALHMVGYRKDTELIVGHRLLHESDDDYSDFLLVRRDPSSKGFLIQLDLSANLVTAEESELLRIKTIETIRALVERNTQYSAPHDAAYASDSNSHGDESYDQISNLDIEWLLFSADNMAFRSPLPDARYLIASTGDRSLEVRLSARGELWTLRAHSQRYANVSARVSLKTDGGTLAVLDGRFDHDGAMRISFSTPGNRTPIAVSIVVIDQ